MLRITPKDGDAIDATAVIKDSRGENGVARDIRDALKAPLDNERFRVEVDDGEDVLIKNRGGPNFEVRLVGSTVKGVRIGFDKKWRGRRQRHAVPRRDARPRFPGQVPRPVLR